MEHAAPASCPSSGTALGPLLSAVSSMTPGELLRSPAESRLMISAADVQLTSGTSRWMKCSTSNMLLLGRAPFPTLEPLGMRSGVSTSSLGKALYLGVSSAGMRGIFKLRPLVSSPGGLSVLPSRQQGP